MSAQVKYVQYLLDTTLENTGFYNVYDHKGNLSHSSDHYRDQDIFDHSINDDRDRHDQKSECHCSWHGGLWKEWGNSVHHIEGEQEYKRKYCCNYLAFCKRWHKYTDRQIRASQKEKSQDSGVCGSIGNRSELTHDQRINAHDHDRNGKHSY